MSRRNSAKSVSPRKERPKIALTNPHSPGRSTLDRAMMKFQTSAYWTQEDAYNQKKKIPLAHRDLAAYLLDDLHTHVATPIMRWLGVSYKSLRERHPQENKRGMTESVPLFKEEKTGKENDFKTKKVRCGTHYHISIKLRTGPTHSEFYNRGSLLALLFHEMAHMKAMNHGEGFLKHVKGIYDFATDKGLFKPGEPDANWVCQVVSPWGWEKKIYETGGKAELEELLQIHRDEEVLRKKLRAEAEEKAKLEGEAAKVEVKIPDPEIDCVEQAPSVPVSPSSSPNLGAQISPTNVCQPASSSNSPAKSTMFPGAFAGPNGHFFLNGKDDCECCLDPIGPDLAASANAVPSSAVPFSNISLQDLKTSGANSSSGALPTIQTESQPDNEAVDNNNLMIAQDNNLLATVNSLLGSVAKTLPNPDVSSSTNVSPGVSPKGISVSNGSKVPVLPSPTSLEKLNVDNTIGDHSNVDNVQPNNLQSPTNKAQPYLPRKVAATTSGKLVLPPAITNTIPQSGNDPHTLQSQSHTNIASTEVDLDNLNVEVLPRTQVPSLNLVKSQIGPYEFSQKASEKPTTIEAYNQQLQKRLATIQRHERAVCGSQSARVAAEQLIAAEDGSRSKSARAHVEDFASDGKQQNDMEGVVVESCSSRENNNDQPTDPLNPRPESSPLSPVHPIQPVLNKSSGGSRGIQQTMKNFATSVKTSTTHWFWPKTGDNNNKYKSGNHATNSNNVSGGLRSPSKSNLSSPKSMPRSPKASTFYFCRI